MPTSAPLRLLPACAVLFLLATAAQCPENPEGSETRTRFSLSRATTGAGTGTIAASPDGESFEQGTQVTLTATPGAGSTFTGWSGDCTGTTNPCVLVMSANRSVTAAFQRTFTLALTRAGAGTGTLAATPSGATHLEGTVVRIEATPAAGSAFTGWSGDCTGTTNPCALVMSANRSVTATFQRTFTLTLTRAGAGTGTLAATPSGATHVEGTVVRIDATPAAGSAFAGWKEDCASQSNPCSVTINADRAVTGIFTSAVGAGQFDGEYAGTFTGGNSDGSQRSGPMTMTLANGSVQGTLAPISGSVGTFVGTVSASGAVAASIADAGGGCVVTLAGQVTTTVVDGVTRAAAAGTYTLVQSATCNTSSGTWTLARQR